MDGKEFGALKVFDLDDVQRTMYELIEAR